MAEKATSKASLLPQRGRIWILLEWTRNPYAFYENNAIPIRIRNRQCAFMLFDCQVKRFEPNRSALKIRNSKEDLKGRARRVSDNLHLLARSAGKFEPHVPWIEVGIWLESEFFLIERLRRGRVLHFNSNRDNLV